MGYKMKGPTFYGKSPMKITSSGSQGLLDAWKGAAKSGADAKISMMENSTKGVDNLGKVASQAVLDAKGIKTEKPKEEKPEKEKVFKVRTLEEIIADQQNKNTNPSSLAVK
tara:strand:+ start:465 stop:797 length:333 start_codon:yes stop_codon:yes gene_type:complete